MLISGETLEAAGWEKIAEAMDINLVDFFPGADSAQVLGDIEKRTGLLRCYTPPCRERPHCAFR
jgi:hypothetical protein